MGRVLFSIDGVSNEDATYFYFAKGKIEFLFEGHFGLILFTSTLVSPETMANSQLSAMV